MKSIIFSFLLVPLISSATEIITVANKKQNCIEYRLVNKCDDKCVEKLNVLNKEKLKGPAISFMLSHKDFSPESQSWTVRIDAVGTSDIRKKGVAYAFIDFRNKKINKMTKRINRWPHPVDSIVLQESGDIISVCVSELGELIDYKVGDL